MLQILHSHLESTGCNLPPEPVDAIWVIQGRLLERILRIPVVLVQGFAFHDV